MNRGDYIYGVWGTGYWGGRIASILMASGKQVAQFNISRKQVEETEIEYEARIERELAPLLENISIVWISTPPINQYYMVKALLRHGKHVIVEKPWLCNASDTEELVNSANQNNCNVAVHYQYCYLSEVIKLSNYMSGKHVSFSGGFLVDIANRLGLPAMINLGSHIISIQLHNFPGANIGSIQTAYDSENARYISVMDIDKPQDMFSIDFLDNKEPIVQSFIDDFEDCILSGAKFPLDLNFAVKVTNIAKSLLSNEEELST